MPDPSPESAPEVLRVARRAIEYVPSLRLVQDLAPARRGSVWTLCIEVTALHSSEHVPSTTRWWMHIDARYPWGTIEVYPAKDGGITETFPHQDLNTEGEKGEPWRTGDICVREPSFAIGRRGFDRDPLGRPERLRWYFERIASWVEAAATGGLARTGDPFELPQFKTAPGIVGFQSEEADVALFDATPWRSGTAGFAVLRTEPLQLALTGLLTTSGAVIRDCVWGERVRQAKQHVAGIWLRTNSIPILGPYRAPRTWGELRRLLAGDGTDLDQTLKTALRPLRGRGPLFGLLGFPIPKTFGGGGTQMHWQAFRLPKIASGEVYMKGFRRKHQDSYWLRDRGTVFRDNDSIQWLRSENWSAAELGTRGQLPPSVVEARFVVIGGGSVGAPLSELLVRGGVRRISIVDGDKYHAGNGVRHTLLLDDIEAFKAPSVAARLNRISPLVEAKSITAFIPDLKREEWDEIQQSDIIVDCTGEDDAIAALGEAKCEVPRWFWSVSLSLGAKRVYVFSARGEDFPSQAFFSRVGPWIEKDRLEHAGVVMPWEGTGCWHSVVPGRAEEITVMVAAALRYLCDTRAMNLSAPNLAVFERQVKDGLFAGVARVDDAW